MENLLVMKMLPKMRNCINCHQFLSKYSYIITVIIESNAYFKSFLHIINKNLTNAHNWHISPNLIPSLSNTVCDNYHILTTRKSVWYPFLCCKTNSCSKKQQPEEFNIYCPSTKETRSVKYFHAVCPWKTNTTFF